MISFDIPWWAWNLIFLYIFVVSFGIRAVLGLIFSRDALPLDT